MADQVFVVTQTSNQFSQILATTASQLKIGELWADSGCVRGVGGHEEHVKYRNYLSQLNLRPVKAPCSEQFQFGDGVTKTATCKYFYPVFIEGKYRGALDQASVDAACPQLLSKMVMKIWDVDLRLGRGYMHIGKFDVDIPFGIKDTPICDIFDFELNDIKKLWPSIPDCYKLTPHPPQRISRPTLTVLPLDQTDLKKKPTVTFLDENVDSSNVKVE